jgi:3-O-methylgallate 3,4-dioxygenase
MAQIVFGAGASHTPLLAIPVESWVERAKADVANDALTLSDGQTLAYATLSEQRQDRYADQVNPDTFAQKSDACQAALDRLADSLEAARPDVVVIVGDDQEELFGSENLPVLSVFFGDTLIMHSDYHDPNLAPWRRPMRVNYAMDDYHRFPGHPDLALGIIRGLLERDVDVASSAKVVDPEDAGFGHAYGFVIKRLFKGRTIPVVPILLNTYYPPNVPSARRCFDIGRHLRAAIEAMPCDLRVAIIASGGLSHFVVEEDLDTKVLDALKKSDADTLRSISSDALRSGSSEILNWILVGGAIHGMAPVWDEYIPLYRTPAGTGVGAAFAAWKPA